MTETNDYNFAGLPLPVVIVWAGVKADWFTSPSEDPLVSKSNQ